MNTKRIRVSTKRIKVNTKRTKFNTKRTKVSTKRTVDGSECREERPEQQTQLTTWGHAHTYTAWGPAHSIKSSPQAQLPTKQDLDFFGQRSLDEPRQPPGFAEIHFSVICQFPSFWRSGNYILCKKLILPLKCLSCLTCSVLMSHSQEQEAFLWTNLQQQDLANDLPQTF